MASNVLIGNWAYGLWENLNSPDCLNFLTISGYAIQPDTLGRLNSRIGTCFVPTGGTGIGDMAFDTSPDITIDELAVIGAMYEVTWLKQLVTSSMGVSSDDVPWTRLRENDSSIERASPINRGKEYREMIKEANLQLDYLVNAYLEGQRGTSLSVDYLNPPIRPIRNPYV